MILLVIFLSIFLLCGNTFVFDISSPDTPYSFEDLPTEQTQQLQHNVLVVYRMTFEGLWSEERFPKSYPKFRPPAHWSMVFGQVHDDSQHIFHIGDNSTSGLQKFAETGNPLGLIENQNDDGIFDQFKTSSLRNGTGELSKDFFVDSNHSLISIVSRIVPSPDWFVGVDSLNLMKGGEWIEEITVPLHPLDAGTDGGLTFTAPKWELQTTLPIQMHTAKEPSHLAASFYYPDLEVLPDIAQVTFTKITELSLEPETPSTTEYYTFDSYTESSTADMGSTTESVTSEYSSTEDLSWLDIYASMSSEPNVEISTPSTPQLSSFTISMISDIKSKYRSNEAYTPKLFRPAIKDNMRHKKMFSYRQGARSNLAKSFISIRKDKTHIASGLFSW